MSTPVTIPKEVPQNSALSYDFLRSEGIKTIQQLAGDSWTDHNTHDPGITILEQLCYTITDLAYRLDYDIQDLLGNNLEAYNEMYSPATILTNSAITWSDLRKVVIDIKGVKNAWIEKVIPEDDTVLTPKGLYKVIVEKDDLVEATSNLRQIVKQRLLACRSLCEDFEEIDVFDKQKIQIGGTIEVSAQSDDISRLVADLLFKIQSYLSPAIRFYTLQELLHKNKRIDEIFDGPVLEHGFIDDDELAKHDRKLEIHASDLIKEMMDVKGVVTVQELLIQSGVSDGKNWVFYLDNTKTPTLDVKATLQNLQFRIQGLTITINTEQVLHHYNNKLTSLITKRVLRPTEKDRLISIGKDRNIATYYSLQNQFPVNYGIGESGLPDSTNDLRKAQTKQLIAYLTLFDQLLANNFAQVSNFHKLVAFGDNNNTTYATQSLVDIVPGLQDILVSKEQYETYLNTSNSLMQEDLQRKNKFLNHLLARFGETFSTAALGEHQEGNQIANNAQKLIEDKKRFLQQYPEISAYRGKGFDYGKSYTKDENCSGLEKRIALKLGIEDTEQFLMVEHLLLRPQSQDKHSLETYYQQGEITGLEVVDTQTNTKCMVTQHNLVVGEQIRIVQNETYAGIYTVQHVNEESFEIDTPFRTEGINNTANWQRIQPDVRHHLFSEPITLFEASPNTGHTICTAVHELQAGDTITIVGAHEYDGIHTVTNTTASGFEIGVAFDQEYTSGRYMRSEEKDLYSLQLSFVFPKGKGRYKDPVFQNFVENTVREETPVHLMPYIHWFDDQEMEDFTIAHKDFMASKQQQ
ncbi:hypothetical protein [Aquimarina mytili]|uniref:Uncharacterized protein n=1 Tax=Aquimarina mytili TaxID=874423 RepID=A0A936ZZ79_9FLAO|nr:hypothetical protein [Aquimarina mytili]MBL0683866.1 hypothetical protein [Aquimarina mytili]